MAKLKKNEMSWLFNQRNCFEAIKCIGARNITVVHAVYITSTEEEHVSGYDKMVQFDSDEADKKLAEWIEKEIESRKGIDSRYLYFRFKRWN